MKNTKDFYNKTALEWASKWYDDKEMILYLKEFFCYLPESPRVLDLCCGAGYDSKTMKEFGAEVVGLDFSEESIKIARERNKGIKFVIENMLNDYSYLGKFDGCVVIAGLVHLPNEKLSIAFERIYNILNDNGLLFVVIKKGTGKSQKSSYTEIDNEKYDRDFYLHTIGELKLYSYKKFEFINEIVFDKSSIWKYYIFKKSV